MTAQSKQRGRKAAMDEAASEAAAHRGNLPSAIYPGSLRGMDRSFAVLELLAGGKSLRDVAFSTGLTYGQVYDVKRKVCA